MNGKDPSKRGFGFGSFCRCKKTVQCVACLLGRWNGSRGTGSILHHLFVGLTKGAEKTSGRKSMQWALSSVRVAGIRRRQEENGEATRCEHCGGGSSNRVALDVVGEEVVSPGEVRMDIIRRCTLSKRINPEEQQSKELKALIWELPAAVGSNRFGIDPLSMYTNGAEINQVQWFRSKPDWIVIDFDNKLHLLKVYGSI
ncbi:hypothetical protein Tco_0003438 [Tanacetum coccineum]